MVSEFRSRLQANPFTIERRTHDQNKCISGFRDRFGQTGRIRFPSQLGHEVIKLALSEDGFYKVGIKVANRQVVAESPDRVFTPLNPLPLGVTTRSNFRTEDS